MASANSTNMGALARQPENFNLLPNQGFKFEIRRLPNVNWFIQSCTLPGVTLGEALHATPFIDGAFPGEKLTYDPIALSFAVDEDLTAWSEIQNWITGLGGPTGYEEYAKHVDMYGSEAIMSDATLTIMNSNMLPNFEVLFHDIFPTSIGELSFDTSLGDVDYLKCSVTFRYLNYEFRKIQR